MSTLSVVEKKTDISVVVPFCGAERYIEQCIDGLLNQSYPADRYEILMVDNNSRDESARIVGRYPELTLLHAPASGAYAARNLGAGHARGRIVAFTDADCRPGRDWLRCLASAMDDPEVQVVIGPAAPGGGSRALRLLGAYERHKEAFILSSSDPTVYWGRAGNMAVRRSLWEELGPFVEVSRGADVIFVRGVVDAKPRRVVRYDPRAAVRHLEVKGVRDHFGKIFTYGRSRQQYTRLKHARPLTNRERIRVFRTTVAREGFSAIDSAVLLALLMNALCYWYAGAAVGRLRSTNVEEARRRSASPGP